MFKDCQHKIGQGRSGRSCHGTTDPQDETRLNAIGRFGLFATSLIIFSQELHKWSHTVPRQAPPVANWLQSVGLAVSRRDHLSHHRSPFDTNYCIVSGAWNGVLDATNFFPRLERLIHKLNGIQPRSWTNERFEFEGAEGLRPGGDSSPAATKASV